MSLRPVPLFFLLIILAAMISLSGCIKSPSSYKDEEAESIPWLDGAYSGSLSFDMPHGQGVWTDHYGTSYEGEWKHGFKDGFGVWTSPDGDRYRGYWANSTKHGIGNYTGADGEKYDGEWKNDQRNGFGVWTSPDGDRYEGYWKDDLKDGTGTFTRLDGETYHGEWKYGLYNGAGRWANRIGEEYVGEFLNGFFHGEGTWLSADGDRYEGSFAYGEKHGKGTYTRADGTAEEGTWVAGVKTRPDTAVKDPDQRHDSFTPGQEIYISDQLHVRRLRFFESAAKPTGPGSRIYATNFDSSKLRHIYWELELYSPDVEIDRELSITFAVSNLNIEETAVFRIPAGQNRLIITGPSNIKIQPVNLGYYGIFFRIYNFKPAAWIYDIRGPDEINFSGKFKIY